MVSKIACRMEKLSEIEPQRKVGKRRKRSLSNKTSTIGCPEDFQRVSVDSCIHFRKSLKGNAILSSFEDSKSYCKNKENGSSLLQIENIHEAKKIMEWLGKYFSLYQTHTLICSITYSIQLIY